MCCELIHLRGGVIVPAPAVLAVLAVEKAGHRISVRPDGQHLQIDEAPGRPLAADDMAALRRWKWHAILFLLYVPTDAGPSTAQVESDEAAPGRQSRERAS